MMKEEPCLTEQEVEWIIDAVGPSHSDGDQVKFHHWISEQTALAKAIRLLKDYGFLVSRAI